MHEMYGVIWKVALRIHEFLPVSKRGCYLGIKHFIMVFNGNDTIWSCHFIDTIHI